VINPSYLFLLIGHDGLKNKMPAPNKGFGKMGGVTFNKQEWVK
jgi:hypothetical protein